MMIAMMNSNAPIAPPIAAAPDDPDPLSPPSSSIGDPPSVISGDSNYARNNYGKVRI